jgi:serine/threonine-protein kinase
MPVAQPSLFYGRRSDIQRIVTRIGAERPQSVSIIGGKAIGKSSLLNILAHSETKEQFISEPDRYLFGHIHLRERDDWVPEQFLRTLTDGLRRALIQHTDSAHLSLIAFFDDFDVITQNPDFPLTFFSFLRSMANTYNVAYVTSSSQSLQKLCVSKDVEESPFFNIFTNIVLKPLEEEAVRQWVTEGSSPSGVSLGGEADWVYAQAGGFPTLVRILCALLWERKQARGKLGDSDLEETETAFRERARDALESIWLELSERERALCAHLLTSQELDRPQSHLLRDLTRRGYVRESDDGHALFGKAFERLVADKTGVEIKSDRPQKRRWWSFGR